MAERQIVVMGVMGAGKTTIGRALAARLDCPFFDADDFHSPDNIRKLSAGDPLGPEDREPWITQVATLIRSLHSRRQTAVVACSALSAAIRATLAAASPATLFVHLQADPREIQERLGRRSGHFAHPGLLDSQYAALEAPADAISIDVGDRDPAAIVEVIVAALGQH